MADSDPFDLSGLLDPFSGVDFRKLLLLPVPPNSPGGAAANAGQWQGAPPNTAVNRNPAVPGATAAGSPAYLPVAPSQVQAQIPVGGFPTNPKYPSPNQLTGILYNETSGQRQVSGGPSLDDLRLAMANAVLNARDQNVPQKGYAAHQDIDGDKIGHIIGGMIGGYKPAADAWFSSLDAALAALGRGAPPTYGPGSGVYFNGRPDDSTAPKLYKGKVEPFAGTMGPYNNKPSNPNLWWAFFRKETS